MYVSFSSYDTHPVARTRERSCRETVGTKRRESLRSIAYKQTKIKIKILESTNERKKGDRKWGASSVVESEVVQRENLNNIGSQTNLC